MIHKIWMGLFTVGIIYSFFNGTISEVNNAILSGAQEAINLVIYLAGIMVFWTGVLQVANHSKMLDVLCKVLAPVTRFLYPKLRADHPALKYLTTNMVSNLLGLGSAATPTGLKAMNELQATNPDPSKPSFEMYTLLVMNTAGFTIIPTTIIGVRHMYHSTNPSEVFLPILFASGITTIGGLIIHNIYSRMKRIPSSGDKTIAKRYERR
ncbi:MAG: nucleoside recognition domain-containing protein [Turicibacter sp.]|nr:nucleoside recognition domain-containing protein [Turicibacter sp.]